MSRRRGRGGAVLRRTIQVATVLFVLWTALGALWRNYKVAHNSARLVGLMHGPAWARAYRWNEDLLSLWGEPYRASFDFLGMPWAATVGGVATADPILALSLLVTGRAAAGVLLSALVAVALAAVLGKVFCSHICPMRLAFELGQWIRGGLLRLGLPLPRLRPRASLGGWVLLGGLLASLFAGLGVWFLVLPYLGLVAGIFVGVTAGVATGVLAVPAALWLIDLFVAPGAFCRSLCPQGFLLQWFGARSALRLVKRAAPPCPGPCQACTMVCPYGLSPRDGTHRPVCDNCGRCVPVCPTGVLSRRLHLPVLGLALGLALTPVVAGAHHNKGLPHYGYFENYPQVPTEEVIIIDGPWEMGATVFNFQGYSRKDANAPNDVKFFVYLYNLEDDAAYLGPVTFDIVLDGQVVSSFTRAHVDEEVVYSTRETLPASGTYELVAHIPGSDVAPALPFEIDLDEDGVSWWLVGGLVGALVPLFALAALGRGRRGRARLMRDGRAPVPAPGDHDPFDEEAVP